MSRYEPAPAGEIEVEIVAASVAPVSWKETPENPTGECLRLRLSAGQEYAFVFVDVPMDWERMLEIVRRAAGTSSDYTPEEFIARRVRVVLKHYTAKDGTTRASVAKWLPAAVPVKSPRADQSPTLVDAIKAWQQQPASSPKPRARPSLNVPPAHGVSDDIPF